MKKNQGLRRMAIVTTVGASLRFFSGLGERLCRNGWTTWAVSHDDSNFADICRTEQFQGFPIPLKRRISPIADLCNIITLWSFFRRQGISAVHAHTPKAGLVAMVASWAAFVPIRTYTLHGLPIETSSGLRWLALWVADAVSFLCATHIYCVSDSVKTQIRHYRLPKSAAVRVLANGTICGVDIEHKFYYSPDDARMVRSCVRRSLGIPIDAVVAGYVGRFVYDKGIRELIAAWQKSKQSIPNLMMLMIGAVDEDGGPAHSLIESIAHEADWLWTGWSSAVETYYSAMDFLVLPSYREGFPTVVLEAAAMRTPSIVSNATGCIDSVIHDVTGLVVPARDPDSLSSAIVRYARDSRLRDLHGLNAQSRVQMHFSRTRVHNALLTEYETLSSPIAPLPQKVNRREPSDTSRDTSPHVNTNHAA